MIKIKVDYFDLKETVTCGQIFRYFANDKGYYIVLKDRVIDVYQKDNELYISSNKEENLEQIVIDYFDLNRDYTKINNELIKKDSNTKKYIDASYGMRIINQDNFEALLGFIISARNNVPSITKAMNLIAEKYGKRVEYNRKTFYLFPTIEDLKKLTKDEFKSCLVGFRDKYLCNIVIVVSSNNLDLDLIERQDTKTAINYLMSFPGIGKKVSSCILFFAYSRFDAFPIDRWVERVLKEEYNLNKIINMEEFANKKYGEYSALALQYMYNYRRNKKDKSI